MVKNGSKKFSFFKKLSENSQKIQVCSSRHADSKNIACLWPRTNIFEIFGVKVVFGARNLQQNVLKFRKWSPKLLNIVSIF